MTLYILAASNQVTSQIPDATGKKVVTIDIPDNTSFYLLTGQIQALFNWASNAPSDAQNLIVAVNFGA